jgi:hypothetical protein
MYVLFYSSLEKVVCLKVCVSRLERDLGYPTTNPFAGMRSFVTERPRPGLGQKQSNAALLMKPRRHEDGNATMSLYS